MVSAVIKGSFPNFRDRMLTSWPTRIVVDKDALNSATRSMSVFSDRGDRAARLRLIAEQDHAEAFSTYTWQLGRWDSEADLWPRR